MARRAPTLFPHYGKLKKTNTPTTTRVINPTNMVLPDYEHSVIERNNTSITFLFSDNKETRKGIHIIFVCIQFTGLRMKD